MVGMVYTTTLGNIWDYFVKELTLKLRKIKQISKHNRNKMKNQLLKYLKYQKTNKLDKKTLPNFF